MGDWLTNPPFFCLKKRIEKKAKKMTNLNSREELHISLTPGPAGVENRQKVWDAFFDALSQEENGIAMVTDHWPDDTPKVSLDDFIEKKEE